MAKSRDAFRTISEVADWLDTPAHVLRFWESKFSQVRPVKRAGGRRYYRPDDMRLLGGIKILLHERGLTIKGVQKLLREDGVASVTALVPDIIAEDASGAILPMRDVTPVEVAPQPPEISPEPTPEPASEPAPEPDAEPAGAAPVPSWLRPSEDAAPAPADPSPAQPGLFQSTAAQAPEAPDETPSEPPTDDLEVLPDPEAPAPVAIPQSAQTDPADADFAADGGLLSAVLDARPGLQGRASDLAPLASRLAVLRDGMRAG